MRAFSFDEFLINFVTWTYTLDVYRGMALGQRLAQSYPVPERVPDHPRKSEFSRATRVIDDPPAQR